MIKEVIISLILGIIIGSLIFLYCYLTRESKLHYMNKFYKGKFYKEYIKRNKK